ncbi:hypothetical protein M9458_021107, partial [Cirrhinus mrigala]
MPDHTLRIAPVTAHGPGRAVSSPRSAAEVEEDDAAREAAAPRTPDLSGERVRPPDSAPYLDPSLRNTTPPSRNP